MSLPFPPFPSAISRFRGGSEDWVSQTQDLRLASPLTDGSGYNTPVSQLSAEVRVDEVMVDEPMVSPSCFPLTTTSTTDCSLHQGEDSQMAVSPPRPPSSLAEADYGQRLHPAGPPHSRSQSPFPQAPSHLQIPVPAIHIQGATPSPVQMYPQTSFGSSPMPTSVSDTTFATQTAQHPTSHFPPMNDAMPPQTNATSRKQRFTMGPRADCELCRMRVKGHYMHFD